MQPLLYLVVPERMRRSHLDLILTVKPLFKPFWLFFPSTNIGCRSYQFQNQYNNPHYESLFFHLPCSFLRMFSNNVTTNIIVFLFLFFVRSQEVVLLRIYLTVKYVSLTLVYDVLHLIFNDTVTTIRVCVSYLVPFHSTSLIILSLWRFYSL